MRVTMKELEEMDKKLTETLIAQMIAINTTLQDAEMLIWRYAYDLAKSETYFFLEQFEDEELESIETNEFISNWANEVANKEYHNFIREITEINDEKNKYKCAKGAIKLTEIGIDSIRIIVSRITDNIMTEVGTNFLITLVNDLIIKKRLDNYKTSLKEANDKKLKELQDKMLAKIPNISLY